MPNRILVPSAPTSSSRHTTGLHPRRARRKAAGFSRLTRCTWLAVALLAAAPGAWGAGGFNLDFGTSYGAPAASYSGASAQAGSWNAVGLGAAGLVDLAGTPTGVSVTVVADSGGGNNSSPPSSSDEFLLNDNFFSLAGNSWSVDLTGLVPGNYTVLLYAPSNGAVSTGAMTVAGVSVLGIEGDGSSLLSEGASWLRVPILLTGSTLSIAGSDPGFSGLAGLQLVPAPAPVGFNVDFGSPLYMPPPSYLAASSRPGIWNAITNSPASLLDLSGAPSSAILTPQSFAVAAPQPPAPNNQLLLNDYIGTQSSGGTWSADIAGLPLGDYNVIVYAPSAGFASTGVITVGGTILASLPGDRSSTLINGVSWVQTSATVTDGTLPISGTGTSSLGVAALQLEYVPPSTTQTYCTAGTSASGCTAAISAAGIASATASSGFVVQTGGVEGAKNGLYFFGTNGRQANSWGNGTSFQCVVPPVKRAGLLAGGGSIGACDGLFSQDLNALWCPTCPNPAKNPGVGAVVQAQLWYRDAFNTSNQATSLSNAVEFILAP